MSHFEVTKYLEVAVRSITEQTNSNWTLHFVDDCSSTDDWKSIMRPFRDDARIRCYQTSQNVGHYRIKNAILSRLQGPFVAFHDDDDFSHKDRFRKQVSFLDRSRADMVGCSFAHVSDAGSVCSSRKMVRNANFGLWLGRKFVLLQPTMMVRLAVLHYLNGFDGTARIAADSDFILRASHFFRIRNLQDTLYYKRTHPLSLTEAPSTGFGSQQRNAYGLSMRERHLHRRKLRGEHLRAAAQAPENDLEFRLERV
ncbi:glycosyltransferase family 2 protein [Novipirellula sp. SH528]|uniref:glycosyltransferase family 2 protein n=1 Tax=Novipirellula sp. SH528 TaxID=3454466 RepID=UPI003FA16C78